MARLFLGLDLPDEVDSDLQLTIGGIPGARWQTPEQLHLTLHFLGEVDGGDMRRLIAALAELDAPSFEMQLRGAGVFPPRGPTRVLWIGVHDPDPIRLLHERSGKIIDRVGIDREQRKYAPHVTLARFDRPSHDADIASWVVRHAFYSSASWRVDHVQLYSSVLGRGGPKYRIEAAIPLTD
ncbi:RNA 2',3'-cyclic phosphodiesterase [Nannocystaceae bacterium ST9]